MATIQKRGPYQYRVLIRRKGYPVITKTFLTRKEAQKWALEIENKIKAGIFTYQKEAQITTLYEALERFKKEYIMQRSKNPKTEIYRINKLQRMKISDLFLANIKGKNISDLIEELQKEGKKNNTINRYLAVISRLFEVAKKSWGMEELQNPVRNVIKPKEPRARDRRLTKEEEKKLLEYASDTMKNVILFALETAMRQSEIAKLKWSDIDFQKRIAHVKDAKNGEDRFVPLSEKAIQILIDVKKNNRVIDINNTVFNLSSNAIKKAFMRIKKKANIKDLRFHDLRHEAISRWAEKGFDVMELAMISGHKDIKMLKRYTHLIPQKIAEKMKQIE